jgi:squalene-associated FAD-dependent desaturase
MMTQAKDVIVIGGGFAGLSAGVSLAENGFRVALLESKPALGGRAYSFADSDSGDFVDNGQHVLMGCYTETLDFLTRIGAAQDLVFHQDLEIEMLDGGGARAALRTAHLPGPFHMSTALLRYRHLTIGQRLRVIVGGVKLLAMQRRNPVQLQKMTVVQLMDALAQSERARQAFWYPLSIATLNDEPEVSSAALLGEVLKRGFFSRRSDSAFVYSRVGLSDLYCMRAADIIERTGGSVATRAPVESIEIENGSAVRVKLRDGTRMRATNVICAVPAHQVARMLPSALRADSFFAPISELQSSPIICVHAWFDRKVTDSAFVGFIGTTTQWLFNKRRIFEMRGERHPGYLSFVISGARKLIDRSNDELLDLVLNDMKTMLPASSKAKLVRALVLKEKHATMAPAPNTFRLRPTTRTPIANLFLAGDWVQTGLPATIESAVISGRAAATAVLSRATETIAAAA